MAKMHSPCSIVTRIFTVLSLGTVAKPVGNGASATVTPRSSWAERGKVWPGLQLNHQLFDTTVFQDPKAFSKGRPSVY